MNAEQAFWYVNNCSWTKDGNGPTDWNCWNLLGHLLKEYFHEDLPKIDTSLPEELKELHSRKLREGEWLIVPSPIHGCGALLKEGQNPHVGLYLDIDGGGVLHALEGHGVVFTPLNALRLLGFSRTKFYKIQS